MIPVRFALFCVTEIIAVCARRTCQHMAFECCLVSMQRIWSDQTLSVLLYSADSSCALFSKDELLRGALQAVR
jgi:hypothetical protein